MTRMRMRPELLSAQQVMISSVQCSLLVNALRGGAIGEKQAAGTVEVPVSSMLNHND